MTIEKSIMKTIIEFTQKMRVEHVEDYKYNKIFFLFILNKKMSTFV